MQNVSTYFMHILWDGCEINSYIDYSYQYGGNYSY
jgi:hypothetical protein